MARMKDSPASGGLAITNPELTLNPITGGPRPGRPCSALAPPTPASAHTPAPALPPHPITGGYPTRSHNLVSGDSQRGFSWSKYGEAPLNQQCRQHLNALFGAAAWDRWLGSQVQLPYSCGATAEGQLEIQVRHHARACGLCIVPTVELGRARGSRAGPEAAIATRPSEAAGPHQTRACLAGLEALSYPKPLPSTPSGPLLLRFGDCCHSRQLPGTGHSRRARCVVDRARRSARHVRGAVGRCQRHPRGR